MVSVCIATYNGEQYIGQQLRSILQQLEDEDEIVVSDDQSTDSTLNIIASLNDGRIRVYRHERYKQHTFPLDSSTHNFENALRHAKGDVIFLADQDDVWQPTKVRECMDTLRDCDFVISDCAITDKHLNIVAPSYFAIRRTNLSAMRNIASCSWLGCCMAFRRSVLNAALPFPETQVAHDLWLGLIATTRFRCKMINTPLVMYRRHDNTASPAGKTNGYGLWFKLKYRYYAIINIIRRK